MESARRAQSPSESPAKSADAARPTAKHEKAAAAGKPKSANAQAIAPVGTLSPAPMGLPASSLTDGFLRDVGHWLRTPAETILQMPGPDLDVGSPSSKDKEDGGDAVTSDFPIQLRPFRPRKVSLSKGFEGLYSALALIFTTELTPSNTRKMMVAGPRLKLLMDSLSSDEERAETLLRFGENIETIHGNPNDLIRSKERTRDFLGGALPNWRKMEAIVDAKLAKTTHGMTEEERQAEHGRQGWVELLIQAILLTRSDSPMRGITGSAAWLESLTPEGLGRELEALNAQLQFTQGPSFYSRVMAGLRARDPTGYRQFLGSRLGQDFDVTQGNFLTEYLVNHPEQYLALLRKIIDHAVFNKGTSPLQRLVYSSNVLGGVSTTVLGALHHPRTNREYSHIRALTSQVTTVFFFQLANLHRRGRLGI
jgi:hypothetical protein